MQLGKVRVAQQLVKARGTVEHVETALLALSVGRQCNAELKALGVTP
jgi:hypothetical protein